MKKHVDSILRLFLTSDGYIAECDFPAICDAIAGMFDEPQNSTSAPDEDDPDWANTDPAIAFHLIDRYAKDWNDVGRMMQAYADAHIEADRRAEGEGE